MKLPVIDFRKVDTVTMPHIPRIDPASFITTTNLLKGYWQGSLTPRASTISLLWPMITSVNEQGFRTEFRAVTCIWMKLCCTPVRVCLRLLFERLTAANLILWILASASSSKPLGLFWKKQVGHGQIHQVHAKDTAVNYLVPTWASAYDISITCVFSITILW